MKKEKLSTWKAIQKKYPDEWVLLDDIVMGKSGWPQKGIVMASNKQRKEIWPSHGGKACIYTGDWNNLPVQGQVFLL